MPTSQDLVPTGLPYGSRASTVARMQQAGVPLSSEGGGQPPPVAAGGAAPTPVAPAAPVSRAGLESFDALATRAPTPGFAATPPKELLFEQVRQSGNQVMRAIFERIPGYKEG